MSVETVDPDDAEESGGDLVGEAVERREDAPLITGDARYTDDIGYQRLGYLALLGSQYGHARIEGIDTSAAEAADGVLAVYTFEDLVDSGIDGLLESTEGEVEAELEGEDVGIGESAEFDRPMLARGKVRYQGQPVAAVVAEERYAAFDALDLIEVDYERLDAASDIEAARADDAPAIHEAAPDNVGFVWNTGDHEATEAAFEDADHTVAVDLVNNRVIPTAMEPRAAVARYRRSNDQLIVEVSSQNPHSVRSRLSDALGIPEHRITVQVPDVGGGFGAKLQPYTGHILAAWCAMQLERPVKWQARRTDDFQSMVHGRDQRATVEAALDSDGTIQAIRGDIEAGLGGYMTGGGNGIPKGTAGMLAGQYDVDTAYVEVRGVFTNAAPMSAYRGAGRPEAAYAIERLARACAKELDMDPTEFRRRNFIPPEDFPKELEDLDRTYDSGDYEKTLDRALEIVEYDELRERQREAREEGRYLGIGFSCYVEVCGGGSGGSESGLLRMTPDGEVIAHTGTQDTGQGHATSFAQIVADELGIDYDDVEVVEGDTDRVPQGGGTAGSRSAPMGGNALRQGARKLIDQAREVAAYHLEASEADVAFEDGEFHVAGAPERSIHITDVADAAYDGDVPDGVEHGLEETTFFTPAGSTYPFGTHVAVVEVDPGTGAVEFERYVAVDDVGNQINPKLVEGQIVGGVAQGIGQAMYEAAEYDDTGNLVTGSLQDYAMPKAMHIPDVEWDSTVTPTPNNPLGVKGVGEAGTIAAPPAVVNAVLDALEPLGVESIDMPLTAETVWAAIEDAQQGF